MAKLYKFYVAAGSHYQDGKEFKKGDEVTSEKNLIEKFPNKFSAVPVASNGNQEPQLVESAPSKKSKEGVPDDKGEDVTQEFQNAVDNDLLVYSKGAWFYIYDTEGESPDTQINEKGIKKDAVEKSIDDYLDA